MTMLDVCKQELERYNALTPTVNSSIQEVINAIPYNTVPERMKVTIALSQVSSFASQFKRNLLLWDSTSVPLNSIGFVLTGSGAGKDSSVKAARKCFKPGYETIIKKRESLAVAEAISKATSNEEANASESDVYEAYMKPLPPIDIMPTTGPGLIQHINDIGDHPVSAGYLYSGEFADELAYNQDMLENIKILSEIYDTGDKEVKYTKGIEHRSKEIISQAVSALLVSSPSHILHDEATKKKFIIAFMSKLARRSWFCYTPERIPEPDFTSEEDPITAMFEYEEKLESDAKAARDRMKDHVLKVTSFGLDTHGQDIGVTKEVFRLFKTYKRYNSELADSLPNQHSTAVLVRRHLQWKALKLAGAFALFDLSNNLEAKHYVDAIKLCELLSDDMDHFEAHLNKSTHEQFADYMHTSVNADGTGHISLHELKKRGFISSATSSKLTELSNLANAYDSAGIYSVSDGETGIDFELIMKTDAVTVSYKRIDLSGVESAIATGDKNQIAKAKQNVAATTVYGYETVTAEFKDLTQLLSDSFAYSPFKFKDNTRGKDHIMGGTKVLVLDVDDSNLTASEAHYMLSDINHHIALTSDPNNDFKFRIILELDAFVDLDAVSWKHFYLAIAEDLAIKVDPLPQSQIFYSYPDRPLYSVTDAAPLSVRNYLLAATEALSKKALPSKLSSKQQQAILADPLTSFAYCYDAPYGQGSRSMIRMAYHMKDLGASKEDVIEALNDVQEYWDTPMPIERFEATILAQVDRIFS